MSNDNGLICCGIHLSTGALQGDNLARTNELNQILGSRFLSVAMDKACLSSRTSISELANMVNESSETLSSEGLFTGYYAHGSDFPRRSLEALHRMGL